MFNETDIKIIKELQKNGRATYSEIASTIGINSSTVAKRIEALIKSDLMDVRAMPNPYELGFKAGAFIGIRVSLDKIDDVCRNLSSRFHISTVLAVVGDFDILIMVRYPSWDELNDFIVDELSCMEGVKDYECLLVKETVKRYHHIFGDGKKFKENVEMKDLDWKLIELLTVDGRISNSDLANQLGLHVSTISRRISTLMDRNLITIRSQPNPAKFGFASSAVVFAHIDVSLSEEVCKEIYGHDEVFLILAIINRPYLVIGIHTKSNEQIFDVINNKLLSVPGIRKTAIHMRSKVIKSSYGWYLDNALNGNH